MGFIVMLGAPGAGKGTQAQQIAKDLGIPHISSGDIFRENLKNETKLGKRAAVYMNEGKLVPDDLTIEMVKDRLSRNDCEDGAVLDGFPRTPAQAQALDEIMKEMGARVAVVPYIRVAEEVLVGRLTGRWTCRAEGHIYHEAFSPPKKPGVCDVDGSELYQREDDKAETVKTRIKVYLENTAPLIDYYRQTGVLREIEGDQDIEQVTKDLLAVLPSES
jgi:adenylate kinase